MEGPQYGVWEVDRAPLPEEMRARQPQLFPVYCRVCDTLMYAQPKHVGGKLKCPDCGALTLVKAAPPPPKPKSVLVPAGEEYQLDDDQAVAVRPVAEYVERLVERGRDQVEQEAKRKLQERPPMPRLPTMQGLWQMVVVEPVITWWVGLSAAAMVVAWLVVNSFVNAGAGPFAQMFALCCRIAAFLAGLCWYGPAAAVLCAILMESSEGHQKLYSRPSLMFIESLPEMLYVGIPTGLSLIPAFAVVKYVPWQMAVIIGGGSAVCMFPILLLSSLQEGSPLAVFSAHVWGSLARRPLHWGLLYCQSAVWYGAIAAAVVQLISLAPQWAYAGIPVILAGFFVYFRVLGRFAWWLAESTSISESRPKPRYKRF